MDADEAPRIEVRVQLRHGEVDHVLTTAGHGERQLVLREEVRDSCDVEHRRALADARSDTLELPARRQLARQLFRQRANIRRSVSAKTLELVERLFQP